MKNLLFLLFLAIGTTAYTQVSINNDASLPDNSAMLDVKSTTKGILLPRMTLAQRNAIPNPATGLMIWQTDNTPGFYYNSGTDASPVWVIAGTGSGWGLTGNSGTAAGTNFIGTTDYAPLTFRVNNYLAGEIESFSNNLSLGYLSFFSNTTGYENSALGANSLHYNTTGFENTALGTSALYSNTAGYLNTASGFSALFSNTTGNNNSANGWQALYSNTTGDYNTATGSEALMSNTTGNSNTATGSLSLRFNSTGDNNTANGYYALSFNSTGINNTATGMGALTSNTTGANNNAFGSRALFHNNTGSSNTAIGTESLFYNTTGSFNTALGNTTLPYNTTGYQNTACGTLALHMNTTGYNNCAVGYVALSGNTTGIENTAAGVSALYYNEIGNYNTANGREALRDNTTDNNTAVGYHASQTTSSGFQNTSIGANSLVNNTTGSYNTALGYNTGPNSVNLSNTTCIGIDATATATDMVRIGNVFVNSIGGQVGWTTLSDERFKENVKEDVPGLAFISQLRPVTYQLNREKINEFTGVTERQNKSGEKVPPVQFQTGRKYSQFTTGFIAQEVEASAKKIGYDFSGVDEPKNEKDIYGLRYAEFVVPLVKAVQELNQKNEELEIIIKELSGRIEKLENK